MADPSNRRGSLRIPRVRGGNSRNSSIRASALQYDDFRQPSAGAAAAHRLRHTSSRYSLNEQFAATRQEYELWDDDASSIFERVTNASEAGDTEGEKILVSSAEDFGVLYDGDAVTADPELRDWDYYDILCLPKDVELEQEQIRRAYYRLFLLFYPDSYPEHLRPIARLQFLRAQEAFEALIDPARRAQYDVKLFAEGGQASEDSYETAFQEAVRERIQSGIHTSSDLGIRIDATRVGRGAGSRWQRRDSSLKLLDYALSHSVAVDVPALRNFLQPQVSRLERLFKSAEVGELSEPTIALSTPTIAVTGSIYGVAESLVPTTLIFDRYQPLLPLPITRQRLIQLVENKLGPLVSLRYRQELINRSPPSPPDQFRWIKTAVEVDGDVLPEPSISSRLYHEVHLPQAREPTIIEASVKTSRHLSRTHPRLTLGIHQNLFRGTGFIRADSGDWVLDSVTSNRFFTDFSRMNPNMFSAEFPLKSAPTFELGFRTTPVARISESSITPLSESGIRGLDHEVNTSPDGTWAISASATPTSITGFLRYSKDLNPKLPFLPEDPATLPPSARIEVELCSNALQDQYIALRNLWSIGRFAKFGLELGLSMHNLHLSIYWSRLGQRISLPLLISPQAHISLSNVFWAAALPFTSLAALQLLLRRPRIRRKPEISEAKIQLSIARRRYEADHITVLLANPVEARQKRQMSLGGLVILSAKFGVVDEQAAWVGDVADVTIALASLVEDTGDNSHLVILKGVRKSRIPGFWDPAPGRGKVLRVEYSWKGDESVVEVQGREELVLPPKGQ